MVIFSNVSKTFEDDTVALDNVSFHIEKGEFVFVVGMSGAGKSTLVRTMMRETYPSAGDVLVCGQNLKTMKRAQIPMFRRRLGVVFQDFRLISTMTVYENIAFVLRVTGTAEREIRTRVDRVIDLLGLSHRAAAYPTQISGGEQQRTALARALVNNPEIIIADEPTANVDQQTSFDIVRLLSNINEEFGTTIIMVTHNQQIVKTFKKRIISISNGLLAYDSKFPDRFTISRKHARPQLEYNEYLFEDDEERHIIGDDISLLGRKKQSVDNVSTDSYV